MTWKSINQSTLFLSHIPALSPYEDYGFRVAVLASIVSSAIILFMSVAFITCCLLDCIKEDKRKKQERWVREWERLSVSALWCICKLKNEILFFYRESDMWQWEEQAQHQEDNGSRYSHKGRNNNNNNTQEKMLSLWDTHSPALCDNMRAYRWDVG